MRVLLIEDDPMIGESVGKGLRSEGFTVDWVEDGAGRSWPWRTRSTAWCCWIWGCRGRTDWRCCKHCGAGAILCRCSSSLPVMRCRTGFGVSTAVPTITWSSPSIWPSCWRGCGRCCAAAAGAPRDPSRSGNSAWIRRHTKCATGAGRCISPPVSSPCSMPCWNNPARCCHATNWKTGSTAGRGSGKQRRGGAYS